MRTPCALTLNCLCLPSARRLIGITCKLVGLSANEAGVQFGRFFVKAISRQGYDKLLHCLGRNIIDFMHNVNSLHLNLSAGEPEFQFPDLRLQNVRESSPTN